jgi:hypothetical protein
MITTAILNLILALGVTVMVVTPLAWAILSQHRDHPHPARTDATTARASQSDDGRRAPRPQQRPVAGHA